MRQSPHNRQHLIEPLTHSEGRVKTEQLLKHDVIFVLTFGIRIAFQFRIHSNTQPSGARARAFNIVFTVTKVKSLDMRSANNKIM